MKNTNYSVKNLHSYGILLLALLLCGSVSAKVENYIGASANVGEWTLLTSGSKYTGSLGAAGGVGFVYELRAGETYSPTRFLFDVGVGAWGGMTSFMQSANMTATLKNQTDLAGDKFDYVYALKGRRDRYINVAAQVPLMVGVQHKRFYMLVGAKLNANVWTQNQTKAQITTYGDYSPYSTDFEQGVYGHNWKEYQFFGENDGKTLSSAVKTSLNLDVDLSMEIGGRIGGIVTDAVGFDVPKDRVEFRLAVFADYGLFDLHKKGSSLALGLKDSGGNVKPLVDPSTGTPNIQYNAGSTAPVYKTTTMIDNLAMTDIMSTEGFADKVNNLMVGLKFTVLFRMPEPGQCIICRDAYGSSVRSGSVRRSGVKYEE